MFLLWSSIYTADRNPATVLQEALGYGTLRECLQRLQNTMPDDAHQRSHKGALKPLHASNTFEHLQEVCCVDLVISSTGGI